MAFFLYFPGFFSLLQHGDHLWFGKWESWLQTKLARTLKGLGLALTWTSIANVWETQLHFYWALKLFPVM